MALIIESFPEIVLGFFLVAVPDLFPFSEGHAEQLEGEGVEALGEGGEQVVSIEIGALVLVNRRSFTP